MLLQTEQGAGRKMTPMAFAAGAVMNAIFEADLSQGSSAAGNANKIELGVLMAGARPVRATVLGEGLGAITADIGLMDGEPSNPDDTRAVGDEIFDAVSVDDNEANATLQDLLAIAASDTHRSIGAVLSGDVAAGAGKRLVVSIDYVM